ncbi:hypothetical protein MRB53_040295 [Persea americana]|nr:hypothetical protein MRB53_040295 [Persea americana]
MRVLAQPVPTVCIHIHMSQILPHDSSETVCASKHQQQTFRSHSTDQPVARSKASGQTPGHTGGRRRVMSLQWGRPQEEGRTPAEGAVIGRVTQRVPQRGSNAMSRASESAQILPQWL